MTENKYNLLADFLQQAIDSGEYPADSFLPGERTLCERFDVSRVTVRKALKLLVDKNLVAPIVGSGYKVMGKLPPVNRTHSHLIGGIFPCESFQADKHSVPACLTESISECFQDEYNLVLAITNDNLLTERRLIRRLLDSNVEGLIIMPSFGRAAGTERVGAHDIGNYNLFVDIYRQGIPVVLADRCLTVLNRVSTELPGVYNDDLRNGEMEAEYMIERGFRRIIYVSGIDDRISYMRYSGCCQAMEKAGLECIQFSPSFIPQIYDDYCGDARYLQLPRRLAEYITEDTAFICSSFLIPALQQAFPNKRYLGHRVEWMGCDYPVGWSSVQLAPYPCLLRPILEIGRRAAEKMLALLQNDPSAVSAEFLPGRIGQ